MSSAATSTLSRWRPAVLALTICSAGLGLWYLRNEGFAVPEEPPVLLHRSNAVHRRSRGQARRRSSNNPTARLPRKISAQELTRMFREGEDSFGLEGHTVWHPVRHEEISVTRSNLLTLAESLEAMEDQVEAERTRDVFEEKLVKVFLCATMPKVSVLKDPEGRQAFLQAFDDEGFDRLGVVCRALTEWNSRDLNVDGEFERARLLIEEIAPSDAHNFHPPPLDDVEDDIFLDRPRLIAQNGEMTVELAMSTDVEEEEEDDDDTEASWIPEGEDGLPGEDGKKGGQTLLNMLYHIAEDQARRDGYIHRGVSCNSCNMLPIRGIRYRCSNCPDYDLCEQCESMQVHPKTHLLYKIRVPAPFFDNSQRPQAPRYPGKLSGLPNHLHRHVSKQLSEQSGREQPEVEALWDTFKCLTTVEWPSDPLGFGVAIDRDCFDLCFLASTSNSRKPPNMPMHDRIFAFFDSNNDNLIGFEEFVTGVATIRTKDRNLRLKRTFWVYDFNEDGFVSRNDFLFMFRSYYALSKELTIDMIQNMEYDVLDAPNPQDIILGTQPISAAYNGTNFQPHKRKQGEGKVLNLEGERVVSDGDGVITDHNTDIADYWEVIADASEKLAFGYVVEDLRSLDIFLEDGPGAGPPDDHPLLNEEWCPIFVMLDDIEKVLGHRTIPDRIESMSDRRKCIKAALTRRHEVRRVGIERRQERDSFYDSGPVEVYRQKEKDQGLPNGDVHPGQTSATPSSTETTKPPKRIPPSPEEDIGQEYLFQMLQEGLNELLDPLFKQREELAIEARRTRSLRESIREKLDAFGTPAMRKLCTHQVNNLEILTKPEYEKDPLGLDVDIRQELRKFISLQENEYCDEYVKNLKMMFALGVIDQEECKRRMKVAESAVGELVASGDLLEEEEGHANSTHKPDLDDERSSAPQANGVLADHDGDQPMLDAGEAPPHVPNSSPANEAGTEPGAESESINEPEPEPVVEPLGQERRHDTNSSPPRTDPRAAAELSVSDSAPPSPVSNHVRQIVQDFEAADAAIETFIASQASGERWGDDLGYDPYVFDGAMGLSTEKWDRDPTMPQNRPNSLDDIRRPEMSLAEELMEREPTQQELKYYLMLDCLEDEDRRRGGAGRLNLEEFERIMNGPRGSRLNFTGMFFEMVNF